MMATSSTRAGTGTSNVERWHRQHVRDMGPLGPSIVRLEPTTLYEGEPISLSNVFNVRHVFGVSVHDLIPDALHGSPIVSLPGSETGDVSPWTMSDALYGSPIVSLPGSEIGDVSPRTMSEEQPSWSSVLSSTRWSETEARAFWGGWIGSGETFLGRTESTIDLPLEWLPYRRFSASGETQSTSANRVLAALQATNPGAVEKIRRLANLEPDWDGYGGGPPTEEAVKAAAALLLETHRLTQRPLEVPFIAPLPEGGLELEWDLDSGAELMLVIPPTGTDIRYLLDEPTSSGDIYESEGVVPKDATLSELISRLTQ